MVSTIEIYDPALCCSTGVCGPSPDAGLAEFAGNLAKLKQAGVLVARFNLAQEPMAFANKPEVKAILEKQGEDGLPLVFVDGELFFRGVYPTLPQMEKVLGLELSRQAPVRTESDSSGCDPSTGCC